MSELVPGSAELDMCCKYSPPPAKVRCSIHTCWGLSVILFQGVAVLAGVKLSISEKKWIFSGIVALIHSQAVIEETNDPVR